MRVWCVLAAALLVAGCADPTDPVQASESDDPDSENSSVNGTSLPAVANTAPLANLTADLLNGTVPLSVNFTVGFSDADGDNLTWHLTIDGSEVANGTAVGEPNGTQAVVAYNFTAPGNFSVDLTVSDDNATSNATVLVVVLEGQPAVFEDPERISGTVYVPNPGHSYICPPTVNGNMHDFIRAQPGWTYVVSRTGMATYFYTDGGDYLQPGSSSSGVVPDNAGQIEVCSASVVGTVAYAVTFYPPGHPDGPAP